MPGRFPPRQGAATSSSVAAGRLQPVIPFPPNQTSSKVSWVGANTVFHEPFQNKQREARLHTATIRGTQNETKGPVQETG